MAAGNAVLGWFLLWGVIATVIAADASSRDRSSGFWFGAVFVFGIFALMAYAITVGTTGSEAGIKDEQPAPNPGPPGLDVSSPTNHPSTGRAQNAGETDRAPEDEETQRTEPVDRAIKCHHCGTTNGPGARFCSACGTDLAVYVCEECDESLRLTDVHCPNCGTARSIAAVNPYHLQWVTHEPVCVGLGSDGTHKCNNCNARIVQQVTVCPNCNRQIENPSVLDSLPAPETGPEAAGEKYFEISESVECTQCDETVTTIPSDGLCPACGNRLVNPTSIPEGTQLRDNPE